MGGHGGSGSLGGHGGSGDSGGHGGSGSWASPRPGLFGLQPPQKYSLGKEALGGALEARTLHLAFEGPALEGTLEAQAQLSACDGLALEGALEVQAQHSAFEGLALEGAVEKRALAWRKPRLAGLPHEPQAGLPY